MSKNIDLNLVKQMFAEEKISKYDIAKKFNCSYALICMKVKEAIPILEVNTRNMLDIGLISRCGGLIIVDYIEKRKSTDGAMRQWYRVRCLRCKNIFELCRSDFNKRKHCTGCVGSKSKSPVWTGCGDVSGGFFSSIRHNAIKRNYIFDLSIEDIWDLFLQQDKRCSLSNLDLNIDFMNKTLHTASLDRIDSSKHYTKDNIRWLHKDVNIMKQSMSDLIFIDWCKRITNKGTLCDNSDQLHIKPHHSSWGGFGNLSRDLYSEYVRNANKRGYDFKLTIGDFWALFLEQSGLCALSKVPLIIHSKGRGNRSLKTASPDRIDNTLGYTEGNVQWVHKDVNFMKGQLSQDRFRELCRLISVYSCEGV